MVRTRNMCDTAEEPAAYRGRSQTRNPFRHVHEEDDDDSADSNFEPIIRRRIKRNYIPVKLSERTSAMSHTSYSDGIGKIKRSSKRETLQMQIDDEDLEASKESMESRESMASQDNNLSGGIRRSTRQRKCMYDTLNQGWLLGSARLRDYSALVDDVVDDRRITKEKKNGAGEDDSEPVFEDMYSRIKRERRSSVPKYYGLRCSKRQKLRDGNEGDTESEDVERATSETGDSITESTCSDDEATPTLRHKTYYLRQKRPIIDRFQVSVEPAKQRNTSKSVFHVSPTRRRLLRRADLAMSFRSPGNAAATNHRLHSPMMRRRRHATHNSSSSSSSASSSSGDERRFEKRMSKSMNKARSRLMPMNFDKEDINPETAARTKVGCSLADVDPMSIDKLVSFDRVGGLSTHIQSLKEMLLLPLMYPEVFERFKITPPQGVLFYGPPGTGKTLVARALANECSQGERKVAFFMRKGADCLSKWVGESERQLRLLFDQAYIMRPSIIFFDEIDGLAPVRSSRQDQIHSSIVSTLLALMDGLDSRGEVIVVGATNRVDAIDPALRRPGRFDREFHFPLPTCRDRRDILAIHTRDWTPQLPNEFVEDLAGRTVGFCGADIKAMCAEAAFLALRRQYPEIYQSKQKLLLDVSTIKIETKDFLKAISGIVPASQRSTATSGRPLSSTVNTLLKDTLARVLELLKASFPQGFVTRKVDQLAIEPAAASADAAACGNGVEAVAGPSTSEGVAPIVMDTEVKTPKTCDVWCPSCCQNVCTCLSVDERYMQSHRPRLLLSGLQGQGQSSHVAPAVLHRLEKFTVHRLDLPALYAVSARSPEESCAQIIMDARRVLPSILYLPHVDQWWETLSDTVRATFLTLLRDIEPTAPLLLLATSDCPFQVLPEQVRELFEEHRGELFTMGNPNKEEIRRFFTDLILEETRRPPERQKSMRRRKKLPLAPPPKPRVLSETELRRVEDDEESTLRELRMFLRDILCKLSRNRHFSFFTKPVDTGEVSDYLTVIEQPMDLETMMVKIDLHKYDTVEEFLADIELICQNALQYNPDREPSDKLIRHRACALRDSAHSLITAQLDPDFEKTCQEIRVARALRGSSNSKFAPKNYMTMAGLGKQGHGAGKSKSLPNGTATDAPLSPSTRCSRRLRGLDVPVSADRPEKGSDGQDASSSHSVSANSPVQHSSRRRKYGLWKYGRIKRRVKAVHKVVVSTSGDEVDDCQVERETGGGVTPVIKDGEDGSRSSLGDADEHRLVNGNVPSLEGDGVAKIRTRRGSSHNSSNSAGRTDVVAPVNRELTFHNVSTRLRSSSQLSMSTCVPLARLTEESLRRPASAGGTLGAGRASRRFSLEVGGKKAEEVVVKKEAEDVVAESAAPSAPLVVEAVNSVSSVSSTESSLTLPSLLEESDEKTEKTASSSSKMDISEAPDLPMKVETVSERQGSPATVLPSSPKDVELPSEVEEADDSEEETREVTVDPEQLNRLLTAVVEKMEGSVVESLEHVHCRMMQRVCAHRDDWDRTVLVKELGEELDRFRPSKVYC